MIDHIFGIPILDTTIPVTQGQIQTLKSEADKVVDSNTLWRSSRCKSNEHTNSSDGWLCSVKTSFDHGVGAISPETYDLIKRLTKRPVEKILSHYYSSLPERPNTNLVPWFNVYEQGDYQERHSHTDPFNLMCGIFMLTDSQPNDGTSDLVFHNPTATCSTHMLMKGIDPTQHGDLWYTSLSQDYRFQQKLGRLILFPPFFEHSVTLHRLETPRYTLSFNILTNG